MNSETDHWITGLPASIAEAAFRIEAKGAQMRTAMLKNIAEHEQRIAAHTKGTEFVDVGTTEGIIEGLRALLDDYDNLEGHERIVVSVAVGYFCSSEDAQRDFDSILGFEDDLLVFNAAVQALGRPELKVAGT